MKTIPKYTRKMHNLYPEDEEAIRVLKARYGLSTDSDCVRLALRILATSPVVVKKRDKT